MPPCAGGTLRMGAAREEDAHGFVFDNEKYAHDVDVAPFAIARRCVTEGEFAAFVDDDGYARPSFGARRARVASRQRPRSARALARGDGGGWEVRRFDRWRPLEPRTSRCST